METHILYSSHIINPTGRRMPIDHPELGAIRKVHSTVLATMGQRTGEDSARNRALPYGEDALCEGRVLATLPPDGIHNSAELIADLYRKMVSSRRTMKDVASTHPLGRYYSSAVVAGLPNEDPAFNQAFAKALEGPCEATRSILMPQGLTVYPFAGQEATLVIVRPFYACDKEYLRGSSETAAYNNFY
jgi:hypothetical protein